MKFFRKCGQHVETEDSISVLTGITVWIQQFFLRIFYYCEIRPFSVFVYTPVLILVHTDLPVHYIATILQRYANLISQLISPNVLISEF